MVGTELLIPTHRMYGIRFGLYSSEEILQLSVKEITNPQSLDALLHPTYGGLYDPALGAVEMNDACETCGQTSAMCPGHFGHINLPLPVYNPLLFTTLFQLLRGSCFECHRMMLKSGMRYILQRQMDLLDLGFLSEIETLLDVYNEAVEEFGKDEGILEIVKERIDDVFNKIVKEKPKLESQNTKNITCQKQSLVKQFLYGKYFGRLYCPHCKMPQRKLRAEHHSKIYATQGLSRNKATKLIAERRMKSRNRMSQVDEEESPELEVEMEQGNNEEMEKQLASLMEQSYLTPSKVKSHLHLLWDNEEELLRCILGLLKLQNSKTDNPIDLFFLDILPVPPTKFRPMSARQGKKFDNPQSTNLAKVITDSRLIKKLLLEMRNKGKEPDIEQPTVEKKAISHVEKLQGLWQQLQVHVNCVIDSDLDKLALDKCGGIKQLIERKEGLFRQNMMGKRVNFAARSVISPDPYINTNEIGIPEVFALKLTYPEPVTPWNFAELKQAVINGPDVHPGAWFVILENGSRVALPRNDKTQREAYAKQLLTPGVHTSGNAPNKKVLRHLKNGDVLLLNRQPTLHKPSIQAHKARILPGEKTLRLHYANCKAYNADFDGDEMNAHYPQNEIGRAEALTIAATDFQYLVPKDGTPLAGLIQDHMIGGVHLMIRGRFFNRMDYQQLVYDALTDKRGPVTMLPPAMIKPQVLWSGKQVLSTVILNILPSHKPALNLEGKAKVSSKNWINSPVRHWLAGGPELNDDNMSETEVVIRQGELLVGILDKAHYGNTPYGLIHCCYELYGGQIAGLLLTAFAKLFTKVLQIIGFTLGVADILCTPQADRKRRKIMEKGKKTGPKVAAQALGVPDHRDGVTLGRRMREAHCNVEAGELKDLDLAMKGNTDEIQNDIVKALMPMGLLRKFPENNLQLMVQAGAKGSSVNCMQISCLLGQIELEGRRPPLMLSGRFLPAFVPYDPSPRAGGFVDGRFLTGIRPQEYFFHCMAGREGLVDTAVKTSRSGYLQRCIIKHLEGLTVGYDLTVRDADGSIVQFEYGEDSLDVPKTQFLKPSQFPFLLQNKDAVITPDQREQLLGRLEGKKARKAWKKLKKWKKKHKKKDGGRTSAFLNFCKEGTESVDTDRVLPGRSREASALCQSWESLSEEQRARFDKQGCSCPEPAVTNLPRHAHLGAVSEKLEDIINNYISSNPHQLLQSGEDKVANQMSKEEFKSFIHMRSVQALVNPGEAVGLLAAQSIGEPSTQMTLNTFHFAGRGEMNVTLGIPRLREILMVASETIQTPSMDIPLLNTKYAKKKAAGLKKKLSRVRLSEVLEKVTVSESLTVKEKGNKGRLYKIRFTFLPPEVYCDEVSVNPHQILRFMELQFFKNFQELIKKKINELINSSLLSMGRIKSRIPESEKHVTSHNEENEDIEDDDHHDNDATATRQRERQMEEIDYQGEEEERGQVTGSDMDTDVEEDAVDKLASPEGSDDELHPGTPPTPDLSGKRESRKKMDNKRVTNVLSSTSMAVKYEYDVEEELWSEITLKVALGDHKMDMTSFIETLAKKTVVYTVPKITRAFLSESKKPGEEGTHLKTEGVNIQEMYRYDKILDLNRLYTNDIHAFARTYGIEAACRVLIKEIVDVFAAYGIQIDHRHLSLIADYMTFEGQYKAFNRHGIESNASPLQKMTFETSMYFLKRAMLQGAKDDLTSPSSRLVVGKLVGGGTGCFDLLQPLK